MDYWYLISSRRKVPLFLILSWKLWRCFAFFSMSPRIILTGTIIAVAFIINIGTSHVYITHLLSIAAEMVIVGLSLVFIVCVTLPKSLGSPAVLNGFLLAYGFYTLSLNVGITAAIVTRLLQHRRSIGRAFGVDHGIGIVSILVESAAVIVAYDLFFLIPAVIGHPLSIIGRQIGIMVQVCQFSSKTIPLLIGNPRTLVNPPSYDNSKGCTRHGLVYSQARVR